MMNTQNTKRALSDQELDQLLDSASHPMPALDFEARLLARLNVEVQPGNVVVLSVRARSKIWLASLPLAASLILGLWLGTSDKASTLLPFSSDTVSQSISALLPSDRTSTLYSLPEDTQS
ncbi:MAG: hypothetical protein KGO94_06230 [Alphaproteobacteria bacterium]|nr:hypothetical protein [Alphaproteobacteria bacterium]